MGLTSPITQLVLNAMPGIQKVQALWQSFQALREVLLPNLPIPLMAHKATPRIHALLARVTRQRSFNEDKAVKYDGKCFS